MAKTKNFADVIRAKLGKTPALEQAVEEESLNANLASEVYRIRTDAGLTQEELAVVMGTSQPVISRIEDADYDGHSLTTLKLIARAFNKHLHIEFREKEVIRKFVITSNIEWALQAWEPKSEETHICLR